MGLKERRKKKGDQTERMSEYFAAEQRRPRTRSQREKPHHLFFVVQSVQRHMKPCGSLERINENASSTFFSCGHSRILTTEIGTNRGCSTFFRKEDTTAKTNTVLECFRLTCLILRKLLREIIPTFPTSTVSMLAFC